MKKVLLGSLPALTTLALVGLGIMPAQAQLKIIPTFDSSITSDTNAAAIEGSIYDALSVYQTTFTNPITVTIDFHEDQTISLGQSSFSPLDVRYTDYRNALLGESNFASVIGQDLPSSGNPVPGNANDGVEATSAQLRAIGLPGAPQATVGSNTYDSEIDLNTSEMNLSRTGMQDNSKYDIEGVVDHEVDEVLGLSSALDGQKNSPVFNPVTPAHLTDGAEVDSLDFYRYSGAGALSFTNDPNAAAYFSVDSGNTPLVYFNQQTGGDFHDWASSNESYDEGDQVQNAFGTPGVDLNLGSNEITALKAIGYNTAAVPEASTTVSFGLLLTLGLGGVIVAARKKRVAA